MYISYSNNRFVPHDQLQLHVSDLGLLRGYGIFDFFRTVRKSPLFLEDYLNRFYRSAFHMHMEVPMMRQTLKDTILELVERNPDTEMGIRLLLTGGYSENAFTPVQPNFFILAEPIHFPEEQSYQEGIRLMTHQYMREVPLAKTTHYGVAIRLLPEMKRRKAQDVLYHFNGKILEVSRSNFFLVKGKTVITADTHVLQGINRKKVMHLAEHLYTLECREVGMEEIKEADEAFITSTTKKVMPVTAIDGQRVGNGWPGPVTRSLRDHFQTLEEKSESLL